MKKLNDIKKVDYKTIINSDEMTVSIMLLKKGRSIATASTNKASHLNKTVWFVNRVFVISRERRKGLGSECLNLLKKETLKFDKDNLLVTPGGYDLKYAEQKNFYEFNNFKEIEKGIMICKGLCRKI